MYLLFAFVMAAFAGDSTVTTTNSYIGKTSSDNLVEVYTGKDDYNFKMTPFNRSKQPNEILQSKSTFYTGVYLQYKWLAFDYSTSIFNGPVDDPAHDIKALNLGTSYIKDKWGVVAAYHKYDGFIMSSQNGKKKTAYPQLKHQAFVVDGFVNMNANKFSMKAAYTYGSRQLKSAGGFAIGLHADYQRWNILPVVQNNKLNISEKPQEKITNVYDVIPQVSYGYNWVISKKGLIATGLVHAGAGYSYVKDKSTDHMANWLAGWHAQVGYNGDKWYTYICQEGSYQNYLATTKFLYNQQLSNYITVGHRF
jgi:hypothetical protein